MAVNYGIFVRRSNLVRTLTLSLGILATCASALAQEETLSPDATTTATPSAAFQDATLTATVNTINATWVPVLTAAGTTIYKDLVLQFSVDSKGDVTLAKLTSSIPPLPLYNHFEPGEYEGPPQILSNMLANVSGPSVVTGTVSGWSLTAAPGANGCTYPVSATWYVGPLTSNPYYARVEKAKIPANISNGLSFGITSQYGCYSRWSENALIGVSQVGNTITIQSFSFDGTDSSSPQDEVTYTLQKAN